MAYTFDVGVQVHACGSPICTAAALHLECAIPNFVIHEHHTYALSPYNRELCIHDYQPDNSLRMFFELSGSFFALFEEKNKAKRMHFHGNKEINVKK